MSTDACMDARCMVGRMYIRTYSLKKERLWQRSNGGEDIKTQFANFHNVS